MAYDVLGDASYLQILKNGYDYLQQTQVYATGGYGPNERFMALHMMIDRIRPDEPSSAPAMISR